jgi:hypothetical protein
MLVTRMYFAQGVIRESLHETLERRFATQFATPRQSVPRAAARPAARSARIRRHHRPMDTSPSDVVPFCEGPST